MSVYPYRTTGLPPDGVSCNFICIYRASVEIIQLSLSKSVERLETFLGGRQTHLKLCTPLPPSTVGPPTGYSSPAPFPGPDRFSPQFTTNFFLFHLHFYRRFVSPLPFPLLFTNSTHPSFTLLSLFPFLPFLFHSQLLLPSLFTSV